MTFDEFCLTQLGQVGEVVRRKLFETLAEDVGHGDLSLKSCSRAYVKPVKGVLLAKSEFVLAGLDLACETLRLACGGSQFHVSKQVEEGEKVPVGEVILSFEGPACGLLAGERAALNLLARLCGVATFTARVKRALKEAGEHAPELLETRKTTPGLKVFEKYATRVGGARNHRLGLDSGAMLKENHIRAAASAGLSLNELITETRKQLPLLSGLEVEVTTLDEMCTAVESGADVVMLDNFSEEDLLEAVQMRKNRGFSALFELSGNLDRIAPEKLARSGVDFISMGALIHQAPWADISLQFEKVIS